MHQNDSKYYLQFCTVSGPRLETLELVTLLTQLESLKIVLERHFGSVYVVKIQLFCFSLAPCPLYCRLFAQATSSINKLCLTKGISCPKAHDKSLGYLNKFHFIFISFIGYFRYLQLYFLTAHK